MVAMLETATGVKAFSVGKPSPVMMRSARKELGLTTDETTIIGDTMETDILGGVQLGYHTVLVLSGGTKPRRPACVTPTAPKSSSNRWRNTPSGWNRTHWRTPWTPRPAASVPVVADQRNGAAAR